MSETYDAAVEVREALKLHAERTEEALAALATRHAEYAAQMVAEIGALTATLAHLNEITAYQLSTLEEWHKDWKRSAR